MFWARFGNGDWRCVVVFIAVFTAVSVPVSVSVLLLAVTVRADASTLDLGGSKVSLTPAVMLKKSAVLWSLTNLPKGRTTRTRNSTAATTTLSCFCRRRNDDDDDDDGDNGDDDDDDFMVLLVENLL